MKLRRRREEEGIDIAFSAATQLGRGQSHLSRSYLLLPPSFTISPTRPTSPHPPPPSFPSATGQKSNILPLSLPSCSASPFLIHKITEASERGGRSTQLAGPAVLSNDSMRAPSSPHPCPSRWPACSPPFSLSPVSRCGPSTSSEAIGKQSPKIRFPVPSPSLTNK